MLKIGEFATLGYVTVQTLRHYDRVGLLEPASVDPENGYRYYDVDQVATLHRILALKDLGLTLEQIGGLLREGVSEEQIRGMLRLKRTELEARLQEDRDRLLRVDARLRLTDAADPRRYDVGLKDLPSYRAAVAEGRLASFRGVDVLFERVDQFVAESGLAPSASCFGLFPDPRQRLAPHGPVDVLIGTPVGARAEGNAHVDVRDIPGTRAACAIHLGPYDQIAAAYTGLFDWIEANGLEASGPSREIYLRYADVATLYPEIFLTRDPEDYVTEVQVPVRVR